MSVNPTHETRTAFSNRQTCTFCAFGSPLNPDFFAIYLIAYRKILRDKRKMQWYLLICMDEVAIEQNYRR